MPFYWFTGGPSFLNGRLERNLSARLIGGKNEIMEVLVNLTDEQRERLKSGQAVEVDEPSVGAVVVLLPAVYESITDAIQESELSALAKKAANDWARDNPY